MLTKIELYHWLVFHPKNKLTLSSYSLYSAILIFLISLTTGSAIFITFAVLFLIASSIFFFVVMNTKGAKFAIYKLDTDKYSVEFTGKDLNQVLQEGLKYRIWSSIDYTQKNRVKYKKLWITFSANDGTDFILSAHSGYNLYHKSGVPEWGEFSEKHLDFSGVLHLSLEQLLRIRAVLEKTMIPTTL